MDTSLSPEKILYRLEELRKWQRIQEQRLLEQQMCQRRTLTKEQLQVFRHHHNQTLDSLDVSKESDEPLGFRKNSGNSFSPTRAREVRLNLSDESEPYCTPTPMSDTVDIVQANTSSASLHVSQSFDEIRPPNSNFVTKNRITTKIRPEEIPIVVPGKDFKALLEDKLKAEISNHEENTLISRKPTKKYLKRGEGMTRFKLTAGDIGLKKNKKLPWLNKKIIKPELELAQLNPDIDLVESQDRTGIFSKINKNSTTFASDKSQKLKSKKKLEFKIDLNENKNHDSNLSVPIIDTPQNSNYQEKISPDLSNQNIHQSRSPVKPPATWASQFTNEQEKFLMLMKQSSMYREFVECPENYMSDSSIMMSPSFSKFKLNKEAAEQNMFDMLETKVDNASFCSTSSFICKVVGNTGNTTPYLNKQFINSHPSVLNLKPDLSDLQTIENLNSSKESIDDSSQFQYLNVLKNKLKAVDQFKADEDDTDEYTESTDTEETCKINAGRVIPTSTPNQPQNVIAEKLPDQSDACLEMSPDNKKKVIKIVIRSDNAEQFNVEHVDDLYGYDRTLVRENNNNDTNASEAGISDLQFDLQSKTDLLKSRLLELESEINVFRKENDSIGVMKNALLKEKEDFIKDKAEMERKFNEDKVISEYYLAEEKEKLAKQKLMYDRHVADMKGRSAKRDREEISSLQKELKDLKAQIANKDAKTGAFQARVRNQIKTLEKENDDLRNEKEKLKKEIKKITNANTRTRRLSNIKSLADINKSIAQFTIDNKMTEVEIEDVYPINNISSEYLTPSPEKVNKRNTDSFQRNKPKVLRHRAKSVPNLTMATSRYAKYFSKKDEELKNVQNVDSNCDLQSERDSNDEDSFDSEQMKRFDPCDEYLRNSGDIEDSKFLYSKNQWHNTIDDPSCAVEDAVLNKPKLDHTNENLVEKMYMEKFNRISESESIQSKLKDKNYIVDTNGGDVTSKVKRDASATVKSAGGERYEITRSDGSREIRFENGNTKIVSMDGSYAKFTYYNGDIKETFYKEGMIKYFYKEVNTYHTTYKDGSQVLQFPDGHLERRYIDGSVQAHLPGGARRWTRPDGNEEWRFPDGTLVMVNANGEQTLRFPNGQTEIHTHDHKRREFPDGTVKVVYADGVVETRYANGRIRVKDKQGNLVMDSAVRSNPVSR